MSGVKNQFYKLQPLGQNLGAEILNFEFASQTLSPEFINQIKKDVSKYRLIVFREQKIPITGEIQVNFSKLLGNVVSTFYKHPKSPHPDIFRVSNDENEGCTNVGRSGWHIDGTFMMTPFKYQTMYFPSVCESGSTEFVGLKELYDSVPKNVQNSWDRLWMMAERRETPVHPLVYQHPDHPEEKTMCFHCGGNFVDGWLLERNENVTSTNFIDENGLPTELVENFYQNYHIQNQITEAIEKMQFGDAKLRMDWKKGDFAINDNLGIAHYATPGTQNKAENVGLRILHRTTVMDKKGALPTKIDGRTSFKL